jgi:flagellar hook assembly protein FlgD
MITIGVYNEAGELVRTIARTATSGPMGKIILSSGAIANTDPTKPNVDTITSADQLNIYMPGMNTIENPAATGSLFTWKSITDANQLAGSGVYYIKFEQLDQFGHTDVVVKEISMMKVQQYVEVSIFNSAGELVRKMREYKDVSNTNISLKVGNNNTGMVIIQKGANNINITYGTGLTDYISWNGLNDQGIAVGSGNYEVQVNLVTAQGKQTVASKTIIVLSENSKYLGDVAIWPNPYVAKASLLKQMKFVWAPGTESGWMNITVYTIAGEKVKSFNSALQSGMVVWDLRTDDNSLVGNGYYVVVFESQNTSGRLDRKILKMAVLGNK